LARRVGRDQHLDIVPKDRQPRDIGVIDRGAREVDVSKGGAPQIDVRLDGVRQIDVLEPRPWHGATLERRLRHVLVLKNFRFVHGACSSLVFSKTSSG
jgi:hypothetical protein